MDLRAKFFGCICGAHIGSSMGAPVAAAPTRIHLTHYRQCSSMIPMRKSRQKLKTDKEFENEDYPTRNIPD